MKYSYKIIIVLIFEAFIFCSLISADQIAGLSEIYATPIPVEIRRNFDEYVHLQNACPNCERGVINGEEFIDVYAKKFIVINLEPNDFGGVWAVIAVKGEQWQAFQLWLYNIRQGVYDLRGISRLDGFFDEEFIEKLCNLEYINFWL